MMKKLCGLVACCTLALALPLIHPFGPVRQQHAAGLALDFQENDQHVRAVLERACQNCHSEQTQWPAYSYLPLASWAVEKDVADARRHMDLSRWDRYSTERRRDLLARIGAEVRNYRMPLGRYVLLHPEARLSESEIQAIYEWTKAQRRALRNRRNKPGAP
jgi:cytochrome c